MGTFTTLRFLIFSENKARALALSRIFRHAKKSTRRGRAHEKNFAPEASAGVLTVSARRKSRESVPTDSRRRHVGRPRDTSRNDDSCSGSMRFKSTRDMVETRRDAGGNFPLGAQPTTPSRFAPTAAPSCTPPGRATRRV
jgi:hypothetical protein